MNLILTKEILLIFIQIILRFTKKSKLKFWFFSSNLYNEIYIFLIKYVWFQKKNINEFITQSQIDYKIMIIHQMDDIL
jgi:hypothetical protein